MVKDLPDYTREMLIKYTGGFIGLEELATRLGFPGPFDLRGNVIFMDNFESELTEWADASTGGTGYIARSSARKFSGDWSLKLYNSGIAGEIATAEHDVCPAGIGKYGVFARFGYDGNCQKLTLGINIRDGVREYEAEVRYNLATKQLIVLTAGGAEHIVASDLELLPWDVLFVPVLMTFDLSAGKYMKVYIGDLEYDVSDIDLFDVGAQTTYQGYVYVTSEATTPAAFTVYVDDIIVLKNVQ